MIISHKHKFIFLKSSKTASTSIEVSLASVCGKEDIITKITRDGLPAGYKHPFTRKTGGHLPPREIKNNVGADRWNNYTKIMATRNPWDRVVSHAFMRKGREKWKSFPDLTPSINSLPPLRYWAKLKQKVFIDFFIRFEDLNESFSELTHLLNINPIPLPAAKGHYRIEKKHYSEYFNKETRQLVAEKFKWDIEYFGYKFKN